MINTFVRFTSILVLFSFLPACGGRIAHPVSVIQIEDEKKSCEVLTAEMKQNEDTMQRLQLERTSVIKKNILKVIFSGITLCITLAFLDIKGAPQVELNAMRKRNDHLYSEVYAPKCRQNAKAVQVGHKP